MDTLKIIVGIWPYDRTHNLKLCGFSNQIFKYKFYHRLVYS